MKQKQTAVCIAFFSIMCWQTAVAQETPKSSKAVEAVKKANQKTKQIKEDSDEITRQAGEVAGNIQGVAANVKTIIKIFEPILGFRLKKKNQQQTTETTQVTENVSQTPVAETPAESYQQPVAASEGTTTIDYSQYNQQPVVTQADISQNVPLIAESPSYNTDGTANLGTQNNSEYGNYLDVMQGKVMDDIDAAGSSESIDLIFTATDAFGNAPAYAFLTPSYAKNDAFAYNSFKGIKYKDQNIPPKLWDKVNESEVALTTITGVQFEKIQNNNQLMAVVKQTGNFRDRVELRTKLEGKVFAVKTEMGSRTAYGLIYVEKHYGTVGANGYLKIKIKVTGFDANGDGNPDRNLYQ